MPEERRGTPFLPDGMTFRYTGCQIEGAPRLLQQTPRQRVLAKPLPKAKDTVMHALCRQSQVCSQCRPSDPNVPVGIVEVAREVARYVAEIEQFDTQDSEGAILPECACRLCSQVSPGFAPDMVSAALLAAVSRWKRQTEQVRRQKTGEVTRWGMDSTARVPRSSSPCTIITRRARLMLGVIQGFGPLARPAQAVPRA